jgi:flagellar basal-body rod protein FlgB
MTIKGIDPTVEALRIALGRAAQRAEAAASNLANVDTPGYRAQRVTFPEWLNRQTGLETARTDAGHISAGADSLSHGTIVDAPITRMRADGNSVDIDLEMTRLAAVQGRYRTSAEMVRKRFALLIYAATSGRS